MRGRGVGLTEELFPIFRHDKGIWNDVEVFHALDRVTKIR